MSAEQNKETAKEGYAAFSAGDAAKAMENISDSIVWVAGGDNALTGTYTGKEAVGGFWSSLGEAGFRTEPSEFLADGDKVVVLTTVSIGGEQAQSVDVATYADGEMTHFESYGGETLMDKTFSK